MQTTIFSHLHASAVNEAPAPEAMTRPSPLLDLIEAIAGEIPSPVLGAPADWEGALLGGHSTAQLAHLLGLSAAGAARVNAAAELYERILRSQRPDRPQLSTPEAVGHLMRREALLDHERFWCLPLDARSRLIGDPLVVSVGDVDGTEAGPRIFFRAACRAGAVSVIAVHNHPTGETSPSPADFAVTKRLAQCGSQIGIQLVDHCILASHQPAYSLRREQPGLFG